MSAPIQIPKTYQYQSYFDSTLLQKAILTQPKGNKIVPSTLDEYQNRGYAVGLHPQSETPVSIEFRRGQSSSQPDPVVLKPGQIVRPFDDGDGTGKAIPFDGFRYGLPFGWLGGGTAMLYVYSEPTFSWPGWATNQEVIFHRARFQILGTSGTNAPKNWPLRFPWTQALSGTSSLDQKGKPQLVVNPTRVLLSLRLATLAAPASMRLLFQTSQDFDLDSASVGIPTGVRFTDMTWSTYAQVGGAGNLTTAYPVVEITGPAVRLGCDDGGMQLIDLSGGSLTNAYVDIVRYCTF